MASGIKGYADIIKRYKVLAVCAVGMGQTGTQVKEIRAKNAIPNQIPLFTLQGNFDVAKLHGAYKLMMSMMVKTAGKALADKPDRTPEEDDMLDMMMNGGQRVRFDNLEPGKHKFLGTQEPVCAGIWPRHMLYGSSKRRTG